MREKQHGRRWHGPSLALGADTTMAARGGPGWIVFACMCGLWSCTSEQVADHSPLEAAGASSGGRSAQARAEGGGVPGGAGIGGSSGTPSTGGGTSTPIGTMPTGAEGGVPGGKGSGGGNGGGGTTSGGSSAMNSIDATTLRGKHMFGYQGWFAAPGDGAAIERWHHWFRNQQPDAAHATFDLWPDLSEYDADELFPTSMTYADGDTVALFSSAVEKTVVRHFRWMAEYGLDGVFFQRFVSETRDPVFREFRDQVTRHVMKGAERHGRAFAIMYDVSGAPADSLVADVIADWTHLVQTLKVTESGRYLRHDNRPLLAIWGLGFEGRPDTPALANELLDYLQSGAEDAYRVTVMGGVPTHWRTLQSDADTDPDWASVYRRMDIISPWAVGRFADDVGADRYNTDVTVADMAELTPLGIEYMPVVFPGFSWANLRPGSAINEIPRRGGDFYWRQMYNAIEAGAPMIYGAMFDEVDEATAFFKAAPDATAIPAQGRFLSLDADGERLPSDWYLRLAGAATKTLRGERAISVNRPSD